MAGFVYACNNQLERTALWECMNDAMTRVRGPWIWSGDYNCLRFPYEKLNGARVRDADVRDLACLHENNGMSDIASSGCFYTWSDRHIEGERIWSKLDRILVNEDLVHMFPNSYGLFPNPGISDHCPAITFVDHMVQWRFRFRFQSFWACTEEFKSYLLPKWKKGCWNLFLFQRSLKALKEDIRIAMKDYIGYISMRVEESRQKLNESQRQLHLSPEDPNLRRKEVEDILFFRKMQKYEHIFNCQRARISWAKEGGVIKDQFVQYFENLFNGHFSREPIE
ncbi:hypothetical protein QQ045_021356 [Rhodiola kirilowii]